ncbi:MAG: dTDP-glucose 4,6-dehydratase [Candidatus Omnitrophica bacterium]|nr:dTDP-glucose 4,6-dehydratase [Candidatus Omnitrophota bacterium]
MKYLITGGAGFIGSHFVDYIYRKYDDLHVTVLDKLGYSANLENLKPYFQRSNFEFVKGDITDANVVAKVMKDIDVVVNFAAEVAVDRSIDDPVSFLKTDVLGVYTLLQEARNQKGLRKFIQISTDEVYGQILEGSFSEESVLKPRNPYSASKLGGERLAYSFFETYHLPVVMTRGSNTYGPRAYLEKVIPLFITNLLNDVPVPVYGKGQQVRDWLFVEDHCSAIDLLTHQGVSGEVYNIGAEQECSNLDLTRQILALMDKDESSINFVTDRPGHDLRYSLNSSKLKALGWKPKYVLKDGLEKTIDWYRMNEDWWRPVREKLDQRYIVGFWGGKKTQTIGGGR